MQSHLTTLSQKLWPDLATRTARERAAGAGDVLATLYAAPFALAGVAWLLWATEPAVLAAAWGPLLLFLALMLLLQRLRFFLYIEVEPGLLADFGGSFASLVLWSAVLLWGPTALWLGPLSIVYDSVSRWRHAVLGEDVWNLLRNLTLAVVRTTFTGLVALALYEIIGGRFPLPGLTWAAIAPALVATLIWFGLSQSFWLPLLWFWSQTEVVGSTIGSRRSFIRFTLAFLLWGALVDPFAVLAAGLYAQHGAGLYAFFAVGLVLVSALAQRVGAVAERSQQRSRELTLLEGLGRDLIAAPPDMSTLPEILAAHVPVVFPNGEIEIHLFSGDTVVRAAADADDAEARWLWARTIREPHIFPAGMALPWSTTPSTRTRLLVPILAPDSDEPLGGIYVVLPERGVGPGESALPAVTTLAAQIGSALARAESYRQTLSHQRVEQELALAGTIQATFLPTELPDLDGWELAITLVPARQTSGDFCDWIELPDSKLGLIIADVADKGLGSALFMALSRTLIRTYAGEYPERPDLALAAANRRILQDTHASSMFVTVFYGILDTRTGELCYCNAGHNPPLLVRADPDAALELFATSGLPLGILEEFPWQHHRTRLAPGDLLLLYTDGLTEAHDPQRALFGAERLRQLAAAHAGQPPHALQASILSAVYGWMGDAPQADDLTMMVIGRG